MERAVIDSYAAKFKRLVCVCGLLTEQSETDIANKVSVRETSIWRQGAFMGALAHFLQTLDGKEHEVSSMVYERLDPDDAGPLDYVEAATDVLAGLGCDLPLPDNFSF